MKFFRTFIEVSIYLTTFVILILFVGYVTYAFVIWDLPTGFMTIKPQVIRILIVMYIVMLLGITWVLHDDSDY